MRISDWSSDVCSSDLASALTQYSDQLTLIIQLRRDFRQNDGFAMANQAGIEPSEQRRKFRGGEPALGRVIRIENGRASCRERVGPYVSNSVVAESCKNKRMIKTENTRQQQATK